MPLGPHILWPETATKSAPSACTSSRRCGAAWAASQTKIAPRSCAHCASFSTGLIVPSELETSPAATTLTGPSADGLVEQVEAQLALVVERQHPEVGSRLAGDELPGDEVRVVLELGDEHDVAGAEVVQAPGVGDEVDRLGRVADEDDLAGVEAR